MRAGLLLVSLLAVPVASGFELTSAAFKDGDPIPVPHACDGADVSPPLAWRDPPTGTVRFALTCEDPDAPAGTWVHWVLYDLPASTASLPEAVPTDPTLPSGARQGTNDFKRVGWGGPCPPHGTAHRYVFRLYALDAETKLAPRASAAALTKAIAGHVLGRVELTGRYARK